jgi:hypothetical protein
MEAFLAKQKEEKEQALLAQAELEISRLVGEITLARPEFKESLLYTEDTPSEEKIVALRSFRKGLELGEKPVEVSMADDGTLREAVEREKAAILGGVEEVSAFLSVAGE